MLNKLLTKKTLKKVEKRLELFPCMHDII